MIKFKTFSARYKKEIALIALVFFVATISFALGYLSNLQSNRAPIIIETKQK